MEIITEKETVCFYSHRLKSGSATQTEKIKIATIYNQGRIAYINCHDVIDTSEWNEINNYLKEFENK